jgi:hypothetical protein
MVTLPKSSGLPNLEAQRLEVGLEALFKQAIYLLF